MGRPMSLRAAAAYLHEIVMIAASRLAKTEVALYGCVDIRDAPEIASVRGACRKI